MKKLFMILLVSMHMLCCNAQLINDNFMNNEEHINYYQLNEFYNWDIQSINVWNTYDIPLTFNINLKNFIFPLKKTYVTSNYGYRKSFRRNHYGIDLKAHVGDTVYAVSDGRIRLARYNKGGYGNYVVIRHGIGIETLYGHLSKTFVKRNDIVKAGDPIGLSGNTGRSTGPHLHFEIRFMGIAINPAHIYDFNNNLFITKNYTFIKHQYIKT